MAAKSIIKLIFLCFSYGVFTMRQLLVVLIMMESGVGKLDFSDLVDRTTINKSGTYRAMETLCCRRLMERTPNSKDDRKVWVSFTAKGKQLADKIAGK